MATVTPDKFLADHDDLTRWMPADFESYEVLMENAGKTPRPVTKPDTAHDLETTLTVVACWFCAADNPAGYRLCGFCSHHVADGPGITAAV